MVAAALAAGACEKSPQAHLESGKSYAAEGKYREAAIEFRNAAKADPQLAEAQVQLADALTRVGNAAGALGAMERAAVLLPNDADVQTRAGTLLLLAGRHAEARARADRALAVDPRRVEALVLRANALAGLSDLDGALTEMERALELEPTAGVLANLGTLRVARQEPAEAEAAFRAAVEVAPQQASVRLALAYYLWAASRIEEAEREFKAAVAAEPAHPLALRATARFYVSTRRPAQAEPYLKRRAEAGGLEARLELASYYLGMARADDAARILDGVAAMRGGWAVARTSQAMVALAGGDSTKALGMADEVLARDPASVDALVVKAHALVARKQWDGALAALGQALKIDGRREAALFLRGRIHAARLAVDEAARDFEQVARINPRAAAPHLALARIELSRGRPTVAIERAQVAIAVGGGVSARLVLADAYARNGQLVEAERELATAVAQAPGAAAVHVQTARLRGVRGQLGPAREALNRALAIEPESVPALTALAQLELRAGRGAAVRTRLQAAVEQRPTDGRLLLLLGRVALATGDTPGAEDALRRAVTADADLLDAYGLLATLYARRGELDRAEKELTAMVARDPKPLMARTLLGVFAQARGRNTDAEAHYAAALAVDRRAGVAANNLAGLLAERGEIARAAELAKQAVIDLPDRAEARDTLADVYMRQTQPALAAQLWREAIERDPQPSYRYRLARAARAIGHADEARRQLELALAATQPFQERPDAEKALAELRKPAGP